MEKELWFMVEKLDRQEALLAAKVPFAEVEVTKPYPTRGIAFPAPEKERVFQILGIDEAEIIGEEETDRAGVILLRTNFRVIVESWDGRNQAGFVSVANEFAQKLKKDVVISVPHGNPAPPRRGDQFFIWVWSSPKGAGIVEVPKKIWDIPVDCRDRAFPSSGDGIAIADEATGYEVAELIGNNNLYIHHDVVHGGTPRELEIFRRVLEETLGELTLDPAEKAERRKKMAEMEFRRNQEKYIDECVKGLQKQIAKTEENLHKAEELVEKATKELVEAIRQREDLAQQKEALQNAVPKEKEKFGREFEEITKLPDVEKVCVLDGVLRVFTGIINVNYQGREYEIGKFKIEVRFDGEVRCHNLSRKINEEFDHPHVKNAVPCLGNIRSAVAKLIGQYRFLELTVLLIEFLKTVNPSDRFPGAGLENWPRRR
jgi:hypothetical protein